MAMNKRERILGIAVASIVGVLIVYSVIDQMFIAPVSEANAEIVAAQAKTRDYQKKLADLPALTKVWQTTYRSMLNSDVDTVTGKLTSRLIVLAAQAGLQDRKISPAQPTDLKGRYTLVAVTVAGKGTLAQIINFLDMVDSESYCVRSTGFQLRGDSRDQTLSFGSCRIETLVLGTAAMPKVNPKEGVTTPDSLPAARLTNAYSELLTKDFLHEVKAAPIAVAPPSASGEPTPVTEAAPAADTGGREGDILGVVCVGKEGGMYVRNFGQAKWYKRGESVGGGTLVFVHPLGVVVKLSDGQVRYAETGENIDQLRAMDASTPVGERIDRLYREFCSANADNQ